MLRKILIVLVLVTMVVGVGAALAQDTPQPTAEVTPVVTGGGGTSGGVGSIFTPDLVRDIFGIITFLAIGFAAGRYNPGTVARQIQKDKDVQDSMERVALNTIPITALGHIRDIIADLSAVIDVAKRVTDGLPNEADPPPPTA